MGHRLLLVLVFLTACTALKNTPAQDAADVAWKACSPKYPGVGLTRIDPDGTVWFWSAAGGAEMAGMNACLQRERGKLAPPKK
jgi:hypothetical protein